MKKMLLCLFFTFCVYPVWADICYDVTGNTIMKASEILRHQKEIYKYCSICDNEEASKIIIEEIHSNNPLLINGEAIDLAHVYYKENGKFINLGISSGCISSDDYDIKEKLDTLPIVHREKDNIQIEAKKKALDIYKICAEQNKSSSDLTTADMVIQNTLVNNCLNDAIKKEIDKGFVSEIQKEMKEYLEQARKNVFKFYDRIYNSNKYCYGQCGTSSLLLPYVDENALLMDVLEKLLYLNMIKSGY